MNDSLINMGGAVKAMKTDGNLVTIGGYLVTFGDAAKADFDGDWFTSGTYFGARMGDGCDTLFHHGLPLPVKTWDEGMKAKVLELADQVLPPVKTHKDEIGIFAETILDMSNGYQAMLVDAAKNGKLGWSSGAPAHAVRRAEGKSAGEITRWIIAEASLTPTPCDSRNYGTVLPMKAYIAKVEAENPQGVKTQYLGEYAEFSVTMAMADSLFDAFRWTLLYDVIDDVQSGEIDWAAGKTRIEGAFGELQALAMRILDAIMSGGSEQTAEMAAKYLKAKKTNDGAGLLAGLTNAELTRALASGAKAYPERLAAIKAQRESDNRTFPSSTKRAEMEEMLTVLESGAQSIKSLLCPAVEESTSEPEFVIPNPDFLAAVQAE